MSLNGISYESGIGTHAESELRYALNGQYHRFISDIGVDDEVDAWPGSVTFEVWADGEQLYDSGLLKSDEPTKQVDIDISGKQELKLVVTDGGNGNSSDHANWAGALLRAGSAQPEELLAYDGFEGPTGPLLGADGGTGWASSWEVQNESNVLPGFGVSDMKPLQYLSLEHSGNYASGGQSYLEAWRNLDVSDDGVFSSYLESGSIGRDDSALWISALVRKEEDNNDYYVLSTRGGAQPVKLTTTGEGLNRYWALEAAGILYPTTVRAEAGKTALLVLKLEFGAEDKVSLYVNPIELGGNAPEEADASAVTDSSIAFTGITLAPGSKAGQGALDELRIGTSYAKVTPIAEDHEPPARPEQLTASDVTSTSVQLSWADSSGDQTVSGYRVYRDQVYVATVRSTTYAAAGLYENTEYAFQISAVDAAGNESERTEMLKVRTLPNGGGGATDELLAYDSFQAQTGSLHQAGGGFGWANPWSVQNNDTTVPGYETRADNPLSYLSLEQQGNYASGGYSYLTSTRQLDTSANGPFAAYLTEGGIGKPGTTLWMSAIVRKNRDDGDFYTIGSDWSGIKAGYFGNDNGPTRYWALQIAGQTYPTKVPIEPGEAAMLVLRLDFGAPARYSLYVNPTFLGGQAPATPDAAVTIANNKVISSWMFNPGHAPGAGEVDELRFGTTYASVSPIPQDEEAPAVPANLVYSKVTTSSVLLSWQPSTDNQFVSGYQIYQGDNLIGTVQGTSFKAEGLDEDTAYSFRVSAVDPSSNESDKSAAVELTTLTPQPVEIAIDKSKEYQRIDGFGGFGPDSGSKYPDQQVNEFGFTIFRDSLPTNFEIANDNDDPNVIDWNSPNWNIDGSLTPNDMCRNQEGPLQERFQPIMDMKAAADAAGEPFHLMVSVWSPPYWMKYTRCIFGDDSNWNKLIMGHIASSESPNDLKEEFAERLVAYISFVKQYTGVDVEYLSIQNEPAFNEFYQSAVYTSWELKELLKVVGKRFEKEGITTKLFMPEDIGYLPRILDYMTTAGDDPEALELLDLFAVHGYGQDGSTKDDPTPSNWTETRKITEKYNRPLWMTETSGYGQHWGGAMEYAQAMHLALKYGRVSGWVYWTIRSDSPFYSLYARDGSPSNLLYAMKHYSRFVRPGAVQVESSASDEELLVSSFLHREDRTLTNVLVNTSESRKKVTLTMEGNNLPEQFEVYRSSEGEQAVQLADLQAGDTFYMPAKSIVTLVGSLAQADAESAPSIITEPQDVTVSEGGVAALTVEAAGTPELSYEWFFNGEPIANVEGNRLELKGIHESMAGKYSVRISSPYGVKMSREAVLQLKPFDGIAVAKVSSPIVIDGVADNSWSQAAAYPLDRKITGLPSLAEHSGQFKVMWDDQHLYAWVEVKDDHVGANAAGAKDDVELYIDADNSKSPSYGSNDFQFIFPYDQSGVIEWRQNATQGIVYSVDAVEGGYVMEIQIPLANLNGPDDFTGKLVGFDAATDDRDGTGSKLAWHSSSNDMWQNTSYFGAAKFLAEPQPSDVQAPVTTVQASGATGQGSYNGGSVSLTFAAADESGGSGVQSIEYRMNQGDWKTVSASVQVSAEGMNRIDYRATDLAGNQEQLRTIYVGIDRSGPAIHMSGELTVDITGELKLDVQTSDSASGVASTVVRLDGEIVSSPITADLFKLGYGEHSIAVRATDRAGNVSDSAYKLIVTASLDTLDELIRKGLDNGSIKDHQWVKSLYAKVEKAQKGSKYPILTAARLRSLHNEIAAQSGKKITKDYAKLLDEGIQLIRASLLRR